MLNLIDYLYVKDKLYKQYWWKDNSLFITHKLPFHFFSTNKCLIQSKSREKRNFWIKKGKETLTIIRYIFLSEFCIDKICCFNFLLI